MTGIFGGVKEAISFLFKKETKFFFLKLFLITQAILKNIKEHFLDGVESRYSKTLLLKIRKIILLHL